MNVGWKGVAFIWAVFLWPILVTTGYLVWKKKGILRKGKFFLASAAVGYAALILANFLAFFILQALLNTEDLGKNANAETIVNWWALAGVTILLFVPALATHILAKRFS